MSPIRAKFDPPVNQEPESRLEPTYTIAKTKDNDSLMITLE